MLACSAASDHIRMVNGHSRPRTESLVTVDDAVTDFGPIAAADGSSPSATATVFYVRGGWLAVWLVDMTALTCDNTRVNRETEIT